jgi:MFS family permease
MFKYNTKSWNIPILFASFILGGMLFFLPILALYFEESLFSVKNVALIFSIEAISLSIFEVPTGAISDLFGRKKSMILANIITLLGLGFLYFGSNLVMFSIFAILNALARGLSSGTDHALIYDTLALYKQEHLYKKVTGTYQAMWLLGAGIGSILGGYLAKTSLSLPILASFLPIALALILVLFLKDVPYEKEDHKQVSKQMYNSLKLVFHNKQLFLIILAGFILGGFGQSMNLLYPIFIEFKEIPIQYFGYVAAIMYGLASMGYYVSHSLSEKFGNKTTLIFSVSLAPLLYLGATLLESYLAVSLFLLAGIFFGIRNPIIEHFLNLEVSSSKRATILSIANFSRQLGLSIFSVVVGYWADVYTINIAFMLCAVILFVVPVLYIFVKNK